MHPRIFWLSAGLSARWSFERPLGGARANLGQGRHRAREQGRGSARRGSPSVWRRAASSWQGVVAQTLREMLSKVLRRGPCLAPGFRARNPAQKCVPEQLRPMFWSRVLVPESGLIFGPACGDRFEPRVQPRLFGSLVWLLLRSPPAGSLAAGILRQRCGRAFGCKSGLPTRGSRPDRAVGRVSGNFAA